MGNVIVHERCEREAKNRADTLLLCMFLYFVFGLKCTQCFVNPHTQRFGDFLLH